MKRITSFQQSGERYTSLRVIAFLFTLIGSVLLGLGGLLLAFGLYSLAYGMTGTHPPEAGLPSGPRVNVVPLIPWLSATILLLYSFACLLSGLQSIAMATFFRLMINVEENTRASAQFLDKLRSRLEPSPEGVEPLFRT
ncbi:MAG: hypothetical protein ACLQGP_33910 [Isosphaeraceae bacterium]